MKVLVDTNVILDVMMNREEFYENSKAVLTCCMIMCDGFALISSLLIKDVQRCVNLHEE